MSTVFYGVIAVIVLVLGLGVVSHALVSSASDLGVLAGFLTAVGTFVLEYCIFKIWSKTIEGQIVLNNISPRNW